jgi:hypothetical protein
MQLSTASAHDDVVCARQRDMQPRSECAWVARQRFRFVSHACDNERQRAIDRMSLHTFGSSL